MLCRRISQLIQMRSIGISDTTSVRLTTQDPHWGSDIIMAALGHERRVLQKTAACQLPLCPVRWGNRPAQLVDS